MSDLHSELIHQLIDGRYRVEQQLGSGGMGVVWKVQQVESLQHFALKTLSPELAQDANIMDRFLREARAAAALRTRHVVRVVDVKMAYRHRGEPLPFIVMELLEGADLEQLVNAHGPLTPGQVLWALGQVGRGLAAAHAQGIVHRDLKPANVFVALDEEGQPIVKLCDFGIAKLVGDAVSDLGRAGVSTRTGSVIGTPLYMAPEQLSRGRIVSATDQWALALVAYWALAGGDYFGQATSPAELVLRIVQKPLDRPSQRCRGASARFDEWFFTSCAREPQDRYRSVEDQVAALRDALGDPVPEPLHPTAPGVADPGGAAKHRADRSVGALVAEASVERRSLRPSWLAMAIGVATMALLWGFYSLVSPLMVTALRARQPSSSSSPASTLASSNPTSTQSPSPAREPAASTTPRPSEAPTVSVLPRRQVARPAVSAPRKPSSSAPPSTGRMVRRARGEPCGNSAECETGLCLAEACR